jgi:mannosyltransferase OCH1-like enzyme
LIPKIIHQTWKTDKIPGKWKNYVKKVKSLHPDWEYKLWTDSDNEEFVKNAFPEFNNTYTQLSKNIMKADVIRYLILYKLGGVYLDLDYEVLVPFDFKNYDVVLPMNRSIEFGDKTNGLGNCLMASIPGHKFWEDVITDLKTNPPIVKDYTDVVDATGPRLLTKIYDNGKYPDIWTPNRMLYHPPAPKSKSEYKKILKNGVSLGIHHGWGSWKERITWVYLKKKLFG